MVHERIAKIKRSRSFVCPLLLKETLFSCSLLFITLQMKEACAKKETHSS